MHLADQLSAAFRQYDFGQLPVFLKVHCIQRVHLPVAIIIRPQHEMERKLADRQLKTIPKTTGAPGKHVAPLPPAKIPSRAAKAPDSSLELWRRSGERVAGVVS